MKKRTVPAVAAIAFFLAVSVAYAMGHAADERGKKHFNNPNFADGKKTCNSCHPGGRGLSESGEKTKFYIMGSEQNSLEEAINACIVNANRGNAIAEDSEEMQDMVSYIKSLGKSAAPGYKNP